MSRLVFKMNDQLIGQVRDLLQLTLLTNTNIIDHLRQLRVEATPENELVLTPEYVEFYNNIVTELAKKAEIALENPEAPAEGN